MSLQATFDAVATHLLKQYKRAQYSATPDAPPTLMYRTPDGLMDAIGCLIPFERYSADMEGYAFKGKGTWEQYDSNGGLNKLRMALEFTLDNPRDEKTLRLLTDLQNVHDAHEPKFWFDRLHATARTWRLNEDTLNYVYQRYVVGRR